MKSLTKISAGQIEQTIGYAFYADDATTDLVVGTTPTQLTINGLSGLTFTSELPNGITDLWESNAIVPTGNKDAYDARLAMTISSDTATPTILNLDVDISGVGTQTNKIFSTTIQLDKTAPYSKGYSVPLFSRDTFIANKARIWLSTDTGTVTITNRSIFIIRLYKSI